MADKFLSLTFTTAVRICGAGWFAITNNTSGFSTTSNTPRKCDVGVETTTNDSNSSKPIETIISQKLLLSSTCIIFNTAETLVTINASTPPNYAKHKHLHVNIYDT